MQKLIFPQTKTGAGKWLLLFAALILGALVYGNAMALDAITVTVTGVNNCRPLQNTGGGTPACENGGLSKWSPTDRGCTAGVKRHWNGTRAASSTQCQEMTDLMASWPCGER